MTNKRKASIGKKINPHFWVFCEGETEEAYVRLLRSKYRLPIEIIPKIARLAINYRYIKSFKKDKPVHDKDRDFLMYDGDVSCVLANLRNIRSVTLIVSNPSIELWFLLHYKNQTAQITTEECIHELENRNRVIYLKGILDTNLKNKLTDKFPEACKRSKQLTLYENPSSNMHIFIEILEAVKKEMP